MCTTPVVLTVLWWYVGRQNVSHTSCSDSIVVICWQTECVPHQLFWQYCGDMLGDRMCLTPVVLTVLWWYVGRQNVSHTSCSDSIVVICWETECVPHQLFWQYCGDMLADRMCPTPVVLTVLWWYVCRQNVSHTSCSDSIVVICWETECVPHQLFWQYCGDMLGDRMCPTPVVLTVLWWYVGRQNVSHTSCPDSIVVICWQTECVSHQGTGYWQYCGDTLADRMCPTPVVLTVLWWYVCRQNVSHTSCSDSIVVICLQTECVPHQLFWQYCGDMFGGRMCPTPGVLTVLWWYVCRQNVSHTSCSDSIVVICWQTECVSHQGYWQYWGDVLAECVPHQGYWLYCGAVLADRMCPKPGALTVLWWYVGRQNVSHTRGIDSIVVLCWQNVSHTSCTDSILVVLCWQDVSHTRGIDSIVVLCWQNVSHTSCTDSIVVMCWQNVSHTRVLTVLWCCVGRQNVSHTRGTDSIVLCWQNVSHTRGVQHWW